MRKSVHTHFEVRDDALMQKNVDLDWLAIHLPVRKRIKMAFHKFKLANYTFTLYIYIYFIYIYILRKNIKMSFQKYGLTSYTFICKE